MKGRPPPHAHASGWITSCLATSVAEHILRAVAEVEELDAAKPHEHAVDRARRI
jgi:hypothetical protein